MSDEERREAESFKVTDRRSFNSEGELRGGGDEGSPEPGQASSPGPRQSPPAAERKAPGAAERPPKSSAPGMDFPSFLLSLATTAMVHLGEMGDSPGGKSRVNLDAAKQMVDILAMLQAKTEGNRTAEETRLLDDILYEIRMKILAKSKAIQI